MSIAQAEQLKKEWTDKYVVVSQSIPELRRFVGLTGKVKTVNMNCRALVEFDGPVDITWYDIDPSFLTAVDAPQPKKKTEEKKPAAKAAPQQAASDGSGKKLSPLELARQQGAAGKGGAGKSEGSAGKKLSPLEMARQQGAAKADAGEKKLSPLEQARQQGAAKAETADSSGGAKLSPLELARQQGAAKTSDEAAEEAAQEETVEEVSSETAPAVEESANEPTGGGTETPGSTEEILALARKQGPFKG